MKDVIFKSEIPIATNNERIFDATFVIEQWFRRIVFTAIKIQYGSKWMDFFDNRDVKAFNKELRKIENRPMLEYDGSNIIWFTSIKELAEYVENDEVAYIIKYLTEADPQMLSGKLKMIKDIRNTMAHHRTITDDMWNQFETECEILNSAINIFKSNFIYKIQPTNTAFTESKISLINYFNNIAYSQKGVQAFITAGEYYLEIIHLPGMGPVPQFVVDYRNQLDKYIKEEKWEAASKLLNEKEEGLFIDIGIIIESFKAWFEDIIGIFVNKSQPEFYLVLPKKDVEIHLDKYKELIETFAY